MWAKRQRVGDSSTKTLLKTLAHWAQEDYSTWVTNEELLADTEMDIKTIRKCRDKLIELGFLVETEKRLGKTGSIVIYQMLAPAGSVVVQAVDQRTNQTISLSPPTREEYDAKPVQKRSPSKSGASKPVQKRSPSKSGAAPASPASPSEIPSKPLQISPEAPPNVEGKIALEGLSKTVAKDSARLASRVCVDLPDWIDPKAWERWEGHRLAIEAAGGAIWSQALADVSLLALAQRRAEGHDPEQCINASILGNWSGIYPPRKVSAVAEAMAANVPDDWHETLPGIIERGKQLNIVQKAEEHAGIGLERFKARVFRAAGPGKWQDDMLNRVTRESEERGAALLAFFTGVPRDGGAQQRAA
ncbi:hypothetical protein [Burkholderia vietnamiensis]|uniref:hypothetical protein n=1 Tax=Burkholderia vietnamiensis TaxID=60552 RepID=UPI002DD43719|nr:hypothetical protein [Burkholderia vietnamiensis]MEC4595477.1 hypothetical protein [Burkholderia vietnamiensis]